jgi:hypothetical protein
MCAGVLPGLSKGEASHGPPAKNRQISDARSPAYNEAEYQRT